MRYLFALLLLITLILPESAVQADSLYVQAQITEATLYRNTALLTGKVVVTIPAGEHEIVVGQLPESFEHQSLQVRGTGDFTILAARARQGTVSADRLPPRLQRLKDSLDELREDLAVWRNQHYTYRMEEQMLLMNRQVNGTQSGLKMDEMQAATEYFRQRMLEVKAKQLSVGMKIEKAVRDSAELGQDFNNGAGRIGAPYTQVSVYVRAKQRTQATLYLTFLTYAAGWNPIYELRAAETSTKVNLVLKALAFQNTGYDWSGIKLTVSSGQPGLGAQKPTLPPLTAGLDRPMVNYDRAAMRRSKSASAESLQMAPAPAAGNAAADAAYEQVDVDDQSLSITYTLANPATMFSDGREQSFELTRQDIDAQLRLATAPAMDKDVFVEAVIRDWGSMGLLPGPVRVFFDDAFTGESQLPSSSAQDSLIVSLGRDRKVLAKREAIPVRESKNLLGNKRTKQYHYEITIRNNRKTAATVRVEDRVPISRSAEVEVEVERQELSGATVNNDNGLLYWDVVVPAGESKKVTLKYSIKSPKGQEVILR